MAERKANKKPPKLTADRIDIETYRLNKLIICWLKIKIRHSDDEDAADFKRLLREFQDSNRSDEERFGKGFAK